MDDPSPTDLAIRRAERARCNGRHSRGPVTERGKTRSSRNALRHGLTAKVHLVLDRDDEPGFMALADSLDAELAPQGTLEGFLVARLTAAMWHTGRAERMEARAFAAATDPDPDRLRLAMRYRGSVQRELFRCLRALQELRRCPLALVEDHDAGTAEPERPEAAPELADLAGIAVAAWGGERAGPIPPGFLELRPVANAWPIAWRFVQDRAFPGDVPLLVYADGTVRSPEGRLLEDVWSPDGPLPGAPRPAAPPPPPASMPSAPMPAAAPPTPAIAEETASALDWLDGDGDDFDAPLPRSRRRNEPTQPLVDTQFRVSPTPPGDGLMAPQIGLGRTAPELDPVPGGSERPAAPDPVPISGGNHSPPASSGHSPSRDAWERMWGVTPLETAPATIAFPNDTSEPDATQAHEQNCTNEFLSCTSEPENEAEAAILSSEATDLLEQARSTPRPGGRRARFRRRSSTLPRWRGAPSPETAE